RAARAGGKRTVAEGRTGPVVVAVEAESRTLSGQHGRMRPRRCQRHPLAAEYAEGRGLGDSATRVFLAAKAVLGDREAGARIGVGDPALEARDELDLVRDPGLVRVGAVPQAAVARPRGPCGPASGGSEYTASGRG